MHLDANIFLLSIFLDLIFFSFYFLFIFLVIDNKEACDCGHMTYHMI